MIDQLQVVILGATLGGVYALMASGLTNTAIAERFRLSPKTVRNYVSTIIAKLEAETRAEAITRARAAGIAEPDG